MIHATASNQKLTYCSTQAEKHVDCVQELDIEYQGCMLHMHDWQKNEFHK